MRAYARERAYERMAALTGQGLDLVSLWRESAEVIRPAVPYYVAPCWFTLDPASLLITSHFNEHMPVLPPEALTNEYVVDDVNKLADVVHSPTGASTLQLEMRYGARRQRAHATRGDAWMHQTHTPRVHPWVRSVDSHSRRNARIAPKMKQIERDAFHSLTLFTAR